MDIVYYIIAFFLGGIFQSAGACIYYRVLHNMDWVRGRSVCEGCGKQLRWWELIPVVSCLVLKGTCPRCGHFFGYTHAQFEAFAGGMCMLLVIGGTPQRIVTSVFPFGFTLILTDYLLAKWEKR